MTVNRTNLMKAAWAKTRALGGAIQRVMGGLRAAFVQMLKEAWAEAKAAQPVTLTKEAAAYQIMLLENKSRLVFADFRRMGELNAVLRAA